MSESFSSGFKGDVWHEELPDFEAVDVGDGFELVYLWGNAAGRVEPVADCFLRHVRASPQFGLAVRQAARAADIEQALQVGGKDFGAGASRFVHCINVRGLRT